MLKNFRAYQASVRFYHLSRGLKIERHLKDQLLRASSSVGLHLAEGYGKTSYQEKLKFYTGAMASLRECQGIFDLAAIRSPEILELCDHLGAMIYKLMKWRP